MRRALQAYLGALLALASAAAAAQAPPLPDAFRACIDPSNLPFSNTAGEGIENKIAELFGRKLGLKVEYYAFPQRMGFIRNTLRYRLPGQNFRCDVVLGVPEGYDMVAVTKPYYRSTYALVYRKGGPLDGVRSGADLFALAPEVTRKLRIGVYDKSPGATWLEKHGWDAQAQMYPILSADPEHYPGEIIERDLAQGKLDAAVVWGPVAGFYARRVKNVELVVVPLKSEPGVRFDYAIAMGVRHGEPAWKATIERLIDENRAELLAILRQYNVPLVDEKGDPIP
ncbi:MAG: quinoprotein dehydrogenase-associated putative ABC transporter substrate-binding protein [Burkholderiaceae bacterium]|nr:quinoprotein dehydrogenase-associated putative ABC transporter substrate-binding protein [Burkholderiaceae bacterium]